MPSSWAGGHARIRQRLFHGGADVFRVAAAGDLRHHAAIEGLFRHTGGDHVAHQLAAVLHHGGGGLIAGALDS